MKKTIIGVICLFMIVSLVSSVLAIEAVDTFQSKVQKMLKPKETFVEYQYTGVYGLNNAIFRVKNEEVKAHLEEVLAKVTQQKRDKLNQLTDLKVTEYENGAIEADGTVPDKLLNYFPMNRKVKYVVNDDGSVLRAKKWYDFIWQNTQELE
jgi:hypothetical protein